MPHKRATLADFLLLSLSFIACSFLAHACYVVLARSLNGGTPSARVLRSINRVAGLMFMALAIALLTMTAHPA